MASVGVYTQGWLAVQGSKSNVGGETRANFNTQLGMGELQNTAAALNDEFVWDVWLDVGTWKCVVIYRRNTANPIVTVSFDGDSPGDLFGTIDMYGASTVNVVAELAGFGITSARVGPLKIKATSKNASSSSYQMQLQSIALIRTAGTSSTPGGSDTPGYTWIYLPWMGTKSNTGWATRTQSSTELGGGRLVTDNTNQNNLFTVDIWMDVGTYKAALVHGKNTTFGIVNLTGINGTQTFDGYNGSATSNNYTEVTGIAVATAGVKTLTFTMATKNASASAYGAALNSIALIRTGA